MSKQWDTANTRLKVNSLKCLSNYTRKKKEKKKQMQLQNNNKWHTEPGIKKKFSFQINEDTAVS